MIKTFKQRKVKIEPVQLIVFMPWVWWMPALYTLQARMDTCLIWASQNYGQFALSLGTQQYRHPINANAFYGSLNVCINGF